MAATVTSDLAIKETIALAVRILARLDQISPYGHVSARLPEGERIAILGHRHDVDGSVRTISADDIIVVDRAGKPIEGKWGPPDEMTLHTEIYAARPDVQAIAHTHAFHCIALSVVGQPILPIWSPARTFQPSVPIFDSPRQILTVEDGQELAAVLGQSPAVVLRGHGTVTVGDSVEEAVVTMHDLERTARLQLAVAGLGQLKTVSRTDYSSDHEFGHGMGYVNTVWTYLKEGID